MKISQESMISHLCLLLVLSFMLFYFTPSLMLSDTTTTGGDMGSHFALAHYMKNSLLPEGRLIGWYPDWLCGLPMFQFYFVPPYLLMSLLAYLIPLEVSFKLVSVLGVFLLPVSAFYCARFLGFEYPAPPIAAGFAALLLFTESYSQWGGNIPSTLAGEFSYMLSFSLAILLVGALYMGVEKQRYLVPTAVLLAAVVLTHIYTAIFITFAAVFFLLVPERSKNLTYLFKLFFLAGLLTSFWTIPFLAKIMWSSPPSDVFYGLPTLDRFLNAKFTLFYLFAAVSLAAGFASKDRRTYYFVWMLSVLVFLMFSIKYANLLYIRFIPFIYFLPLLLASEAIARLSRNFKAKSLFTLIVVFLTLIWVAYGVSGVLDRIDAASGFPVLKPAYASLDDGMRQTLQFGVSDFTSTGVSYIPHWIKWNYEGLEKKNQYSSFVELNSYLRDAPLPGRVDFEYNDQYDKYGTPRVFEVSPVFSDRSTLEALLLESSLSFPYFYYIQKQVSQTAWWPGFPLEVPSFDPDAGAESLGIYNVQYFVASTSATKEALRSNPRYTFQESVGEFDVYSLNEGSSYVEALQREPVLIVTDDWKRFSYDWFSSERRDVFFAYTSELDEHDLENFRIIVLDKPAAFEDDGLHEVFYSKDLSAAIDASKPLEACQVSESVSAEDVFVEGACAGRPLLVKVSYFPNWQAEGADRVYVASPSLMMLFPEGSDVHLFYGAVFSDLLGNIMSFIGISVVLYWLLSQNKAFREAVHERVLSVIRYDEASSFLEEKKPVIREHAALLPSWVKEHYLPVLATLILISLAVGFMWVQGQKQECDSICLSGGFSGGQRYFRGEVVDSISFGSSRSAGYERCGFECTAICDAGRKDLVYVSGGYVAFNLSVMPGAENTLVLSLMDNVNCRAADIYVNDVFLETLIGYGKYNMHDFELEIPGELAGEGRIRVRLQSNDSCFGWDLYSAQVRTPNCVCY